MDKSVISLSKSGTTFKTTINSFGPEDSGVYFLTARNGQAEEKYPVIINIRPSLQLTEVTECAVDDG